MRIRILHLLICLAAMSLPFWVSDSKSSVDLDAFPGWPTHFDGALLEALAVDEKSREFEEGFPGRIAVFRQGPRRVVLHWIATPTREFHFSSLCLQGRGWKIESQPLKKEASGLTWAVRNCEREGEKARLRQRVVDAKGEAWYDESAWYWATLRGETTGPWMAWTVVDPIVESAEGF